MIPPNQETNNSTSSTTPTPHPIQTQQSYDELERYGQWLISIPRENIALLRSTPEYTEFCTAFERLGVAHRNVLLKSRAAVRSGCGEGVGVGVGVGGGGGGGTKGGNGGDTTEVDSNDVPLDGACSTSTTPTTTASSSSSSSSSASSSSSSCTTTTPTPPTTHYSFLQHLADDELILLLLSFLPCTSLTRASRTCHRFHQLAHTSARQRTSSLIRRGHLCSESGVLVPGSSLIRGIGGGGSGGMMMMGSTTAGIHGGYSVGGVGAGGVGGGIIGGGGCMKLLRAKEQMDGVLPDTERGGPTVRIPFLGLKRRVVVSGSGDPEYDGIYFCTGSNGNGFLFSKPRMVGVGVGVGVGSSSSGNNGRRMVVREENGRGRGGGDEDGAYVDADGEETGGFFVGRKLRCIIGKRFSNETILWYMSKEIEQENGNITQFFSFWARLMKTGDASSDVCRYPSQTSVLSRNGDPAWQSLDGTLGTAPPIVELLD